MLRERASLWTDRLLLLLLQSICRHYQINLSGFNMQCENAARVFKAAIRVYSFMPAFIFHCCFSTGRTVGILKLKNACSLLHACSFWLYLKALKQLVFRDLGNVASLFLSITDSSNSYSLLATIFRIELKMWVWFYKKVPLPQFAVGRSSPKTTCSRSYVWRSKIIQRSANYDQPDQAVRKL